MGIAWNIIVVGAINIILKCYYWRICILIIDLIVASLENIRRGIEPTSSKIRIIGRNNWIIVYLWRIKADRISIDSVLRYRLMICWLDKISLLLLSNNRLLWFNKFDFWFYHCWSNGTSSCINSTDKRLRWFFILKFEKSQISQFIWQLLDSKLV